MCVSRTRSSCAYCCQLVALNPGVLSLPSLKMDMSSPTAALDVWVLPGCRTLGEIRGTAVRNGRGSLRTLGQATSFGIWQQVDLAAPLQKLSLSLSSLKKP